MSPANCQRFPDSGRSPTPAATREHDRQVLPEHAERRAPGQRVPAAPQDRSKCAMHARRIPPQGPVAICDTAQDDRSKSPAAIGKSPPVWGQATIYSQFFPNSRREPPHRSVLRGCKRAGGPHNRSCPRLTPDSPGSPRASSQGRRPPGCRGESQAFSAKNGCFCRKNGGASKPETPGCRAVVERATRRGP